MSVRTRHFTLPTALLVAALVVAASPTSAQLPDAAIDTVLVEAASRVGGAAVRGRSVEILGREEIARLGARTVGEPIDRAAGVDLMARSPASADVAIRGSTFEQVLVLVDGVRMNDAQTGHFHLDLAVPLDQVERIEIVRGAGSAVHGADAVGGVINVVTRSDVRGLRAAADAGTFGTVGLSATGSGDAGAVRYDVGGELRRSDGHREGTDYRISKLRGAVGLPLLGRTLRADAAAAERSFGADHFYAPFPSFEETRTVTASVGLRGEGDAPGLEPRISLRHHDDDFILIREDPEVYRNLHTTLQVGGEVIGRAATAGLPIVAGVEAYRDRIRSETLGDRTEDRSAAFAETVLGRAAASLTAGARLDWHSAFGAALTPSLAASLEAAPGIRLRASTGGGFRTPSWTDRYYQDPANIGSPDLAPERTWTTDAGVDLTRDDARLSATLFHRRARDLIDWVRPVSAGDEVPWRSRNIATATFRGVEAQGVASGPLGSAWIARGSWLSVQADEDEAHESKYALRPLTEEASLEGRLPLPAGVDLRAVSRTRQRAGEERHLLFDAGARWSARPGVTVSLDLRNLTDVHYLDIVGQPAAGRSITLGAEVAGR